MKIDRLIGILTILLQNEKVTAPYLAEKFEVSRRTINRDIEDICKAGIPVVTLQGTGGGIRIADGFKIDKTVFTSDELKTIFAGLQSLDSISEVTKYKQIINKFSGGDDTVYSDQNNILIDLSSHYKNTLAPKIERIQQAISEKWIVYFDYFYDKGEALKKIEPYLIIFKWSSWYVFGYCIEKQDFRLFKLNRLWNLAVTDIKFELRDLPPSKTEFDQYFSDEINLVAIFDESVKYRLVEEYGVDCFSYAEDNQLLFKFPFTNKESLFQWILSFGDKAEIIEPQELRTEISQRLKKSLKKYSQHDI
ncbi:helix-turn-helix transcriptional regulator [Alkaliphilus sp. B6464]|uniref:helix-turn-helix transcriptional regulator n=1 Tax=Alkaliphilus sp. B6464 TaxID=2731219 RepID=UPI001BA665CB|nr:YafY family protein [Alkaliphilus sp. B6464]QUH19704.1 YafY family transcriptional regulator [Alkaliphilus sp. B6464]